MFNATFCTVGRYASEDSAQPVMNEVLIVPLRLPVLLYGVETCFLLVHDRRSYEFTIARSFM